MDVDMGLSMGPGVRTPLFNINDRAYVPHTDKYYEAKILKAEYRCAAAQPAGLFVWICHALELHAHLLLQRCHWLVLLPALCWLEQKV